MKRVLLILLLLILVLLITTYFFNRTETEKSLLTITFQARELKFQNLDKFGAQEIVTSRAEKYSAYSLREIVFSLQEDPGKYTQIIFHSRDGGSVAVSLSELEDLYLAPISRNEENYLRLIIPNDDFAQRWLKYVEKIEFVNAETE